MRILNNYFNSLNSEIYTNNSEDYNNNRLMKIIETKLETQYNLERMRKQI